jgi:hypothetical protein
MPTGNPFTTAQAPAALQMLAPDIATQQTQLARQQQMADLLRQQALQPDQGTQVINGWAVRKSPLEALGRMATALMAKNGQSDIDEKQMALSKALQGRMGDILGGGASQDQASAALKQGAAEQPSQPDETGALVNQGGVGPTVQNAARMDALPPPQPNNFNMGNLLKGQVIADLGGQAAGAAYWDQFKPTEGMKTDKYLGISQDQARAFETAKRGKEGYIAPTRLGEGAYADSNGNVQGLPTAAPAGYINQRGPDGQWMTAPVGGGTEAVQTSEQAKTLGKTLGTLNQGVDSSGAPIYFIGVPSGAPGMPSRGPAPSLPQSAPPATPPIDLNHMTPQERAKVQQQAQAQFNLQPGSAPGRSVQGAMPQNQPTAAPAPQTGMIRPGNAPGFNDYQQSQAKATSDRRSDLIKQAQDSPGRVNVLDNILDLSKAGVQTGPTADWKNQFKGFAADTLGIKDWKDDVAHYQEAVKFMSQNATRAWQAAGGSGTDAQLAQITKGNVNNGMFPQAVQGMARYAKAGELALQGMTNAMQAANITDPASQQKFESTWRQNLDPRIYQMKVMDPAEAKAFVTNLQKTDPAGYATLLKKAQVLKQMGGL